MDGILEKVYSHPPANDTPPSFDTLLTSQYLTQYYINFCEINFYMHYKLASTIVQNLGATEAVLVLLWGFQNGLFSEIAEIQSHHPMIHP